MRCIAEQTSHLARYQGITLRNYHMSARELQEISGIFPRPRSRTAARVAELGHNLLRAGAFAWNMHKRVKNGALPIEYENFEALEVIEEIQRLMEKMGDPSAFREWTNSADYATSSETFFHTPSSEGAPHISQLQESTRTRRNASRAAGQTASM